VSTDHPDYGEHTSLFGIISRVCKYPGIEASLNAITTQHDNSVFIGLQELFIKKYIPLLVEELLLTVGVEGLGRGFITQMFCNEIFEFIGQLD
jgi:hypothetical protein